MVKEEFIKARTMIISELLDNPDKTGIYPTTKCFEQLDSIYDKITSELAKEWKKYPENAPNHEGQLNRYYLLQFSDETFEVDSWDGQSWNCFSDSRFALNNPIAYIEINPFNPIIHEPKGGKP